MWMPAEINGLKTESIGRRLW